MLRARTCIRSSAAKSARESRALFGGRYRAQARQPSFNRFHRREISGSCFSGKRSLGPRLSIASQRHFPILGLFDQGGRDDDLGAMGRIHEREGIPRSWNEFLQPLFLWLNWRVDVFGGRRIDNDLARLEDI